VSLVTNVVLFQLASEYFRELNAVRLDPLGLSMHAVNPVPALGADQRRVVVFGDSRAMMWFDPPGLPRYQFINRGVAQQTTAQALARFDHEIPSLRPDIVVLELGVNDLKTIPLFPSRRHDIVETSKRNMHEIVGKIRALGAEVVLVTVFPLGPINIVRRPFWSDDVARAIEEINRDLETLAENHVLILHADEVLLDRTHVLRSPFSRDMLHLTPAAYAALNEQMLVPILKTLR
jgi:lysophospholipase L1-like esterase